jgi:hypothetical protein
VLASLGMIDVKAPSFTYGVARDPYVRVVNAELLLEARARREEIEAAKAAAAKLAEQKDMALNFAQRLALIFRHPHQEVNGGDLVDMVGGFLAEAGFLTWARVGFMEANGYAVTRDGDAFTVTGPDDYRASCNEDGLGEVYAEVFDLTEPEDEDGEDEGDDEGVSHG